MAPSTVSRSSERHSHGPLTLPIPHDIQVGPLLAALLPRPEPTDTATH
jgi:hypothetical protein